MKTCRDCGREKPLSDFYRHAQMADGHLNKCKVCVKNRVALTYARKVQTVEGRQAERARGRDKYQRLYRGKEWAGHGDATVRWQERNPQKRQAHTAVNNAVRDGRLVKPDNCESCRLSRPLHGHHDDYSKPLEVRWLCSPCHMVLHRKSA